MGSKAKTILLEMLVKAETQLELNWKDVEHPVKIKKQFALNWKQVKHTVEA